MSDTIINVDFSRVQVWGGSNPVLPVGEKQLVKIEKAEVKSSKKEANNGQAVLTLRILDGANQGKVGTLTLSIFHSNTTTSEIALSKLVAIALVTGGTPRDLRTLYERPFRIDVVPQTTDPKYTDVINFYDQQGNPAHTLQNAPVASQGAGTPNFQAQGGQQQAPQGGFGSPQGGFSAPQQNNAPQGGFTPPQVQFDPNAAVSVAGGAPGGFGAPAVQPNQAQPNTGGFPGANSGFSAPAGGFGAPQNQAQPAAGNAGFQGGFSAPQNQGQANFQPAAGFSQPPQNQPGQVQGGFGGSTWNGGNQQ